MRILSVIVGFFLVLSPVFAQDQFVPDRHVALSRDQDFYGADLSQIFDTTLEACTLACTTNPQCRAFTFNARSQSCFPKKEVLDRSPYEGAISGIVLDVPASLETTARERANEVSFLKSSDFEAAYSQAQDLHLRHAVGGQAVEELLARLDALRGSEAVLPRINLLGQALTLENTSSLWIDYATLLQRIKMKQSSQQRQMQRRGLSASLNGFLRAETRARQTNGLLALATGLEQTGRGKDSLRVLRVAEAKQARKDVSDALVRAETLFGFRVSDTQVEHNLADPRVCVTFSDPLVEGGIEYLDFLQLSDQKLAVEIAGTQLCLRGAEHGTTQNVTLRAGLPAANGEVLSKSVDLSLYVRDRNPSVRFPGRAYVLPKTDQAALPIETVNTDDVSLTLHKVSDRNVLRAVQDGFLRRTLSPYQLDQFKGQIGEVIWEGVGAVQNTLNQTMTTRLDLGDALDGHPAGIYALRAKTKTQNIYQTPEALQWFVVSDLGISTAQGADGLHAFVMGLGRASPLAGVDVSVLSKTNTVLGTAQTNEAGYVLFDAALLRGTGKSEPAMLTARLGDDLSFLSLTDPEFDLSDRGVEGREPAGAIDVFMSTDRGAYRAGETIFATALVRDGEAAAIDDLPVVAVLTRPDGIEYSRHSVVELSGGGAVFAMPVAQTAPRGTWSIEVFADLNDAPLQSLNVLVEDFLPERVDMALNLPVVPAKIGSSVSMQAQVDYLFGAPAADLALEGEFVLRKSAMIKGYAGYSFGQHDAQIPTRLTNFPQGIRTDKNGTVSIPLNMPESQIKGVPFEVAITTRVLDGTGRPVERQLVSQVQGASQLIGLKPLFEDNVVGQGDQARFDVVALNADQVPVVAALRWELNKVTTRYQWYQQYGSWNWEPTTTRKRIAEGAISVDGPTPLEMDVEWGEYELLVATTSGEYVASSTTFYAGWYAPQDTTTTPDTLSVSLDKSDYGVGDTARLRVSPRAAGTALIRVMSNRLIHSEMVEVSAGDNVIPLSVTTEWGAGAYVSATVLRPMDIQAGRVPSRSIGLAYAKIDPDQKQLQVNLVHDAAVSARGPIKTQIKVEGLKAGESGFVTLAAVDVGILNITGFDAPNPSDHYFGQRKLGLGLHDVYGRLIDGLNGALGQVRSGGDAGTSIDMQSPPPTEDLVRFFAGPIAVDANGMAEVTFDVPDFNGTLRFMAIAWSKTGVGQSNADLVLADPVVLAASLPRFLAPNDNSELRIELTNLSVPDGNADVTVVTSDGLEISNGVRSVTITQGAQSTLILPIFAVFEGEQTVDITLTLPDGIRLEKTLKLDVVANDPTTSRTSRFELGAGDRFGLTADILTGFRLQSAHAMLTVGPIAQLDVAGMLQVLDRYPYGCTEQVTSQAMPLLYLSGLSEALGLRSPIDAEKRIQDSIAQVLARQTSSGGFGLWRAEGGDLWLDAYVSDFLSRAKEQGHNVPQAGFDQALRNLQNRVNYAGDFENGGQDLAYALYVLAREGQAAMNDLRYYADVKADALATPLALAQLGSALAQYGDQRRADRLFKAAQNRLDGASERTKLWRTDFGTETRDVAGVLSLAQEAGSTAIDRASLLRRIGSNSEARSIQEAAWSLMAARSLLEVDQGMLLDNEPMQGPVKRLALEDLQSDLRNTSEVPQVLTLTTFGVPDVAPVAGGTGYRIERIYYNLEGQQIDPSRVSIGQRLVSVLRVQPFGNQEGRLMVRDPLPAGFEIDNPSLLRAGDVRSLDWLTLANAEHAEFRSDQFLAAVNHRGDKPFQLAYVVRATVPGDYHHPAASVEDMYRPILRANSDSGRISVAR